MARRRRSSRIAVRRAVLAIGVVVLLLGVTLTVVAGSSTRLAAGTTIAGAEVGGLGLGDATATLARRSAALQRRPVSFLAGGRTFELTASQLGVRPDWESAVHRAAAAGDGFAPVRGIRRIQTKLFGADVAPEVAVYPSVLAYTVGRIAAAVDRPAVDASVRRRGLSVSVAPDRAGLTLDRARARALIVEALADLERRGPVRLPLVVAQPAVTRAQLAKAAVVARTALSAPVTLTAGPTRFRLPRWKVSELLRLPSGGATEVAIAGPKADQWLASLARSIGRTPSNATFAAVPGGVEVVPARPGRALDVEASRAAVARAAFSPTARTAPLVVETAQPERSTAEAKAMGITGVVGSYTTTYGGTPGRVHNVRLVADLIDGALIAPGTRFSFNDTTGERNAAKGFEEAPVIINGELQTGIGGGVCQVSTTVFNAAFEAGLSIDRRTNHALYIDHYPLGRDATVNYPDLDLVFTNDTDRWLLLRTFVGAGSLTVNLYGTPQDRRVETETAPLEVDGKVPWKRIDDPTLFRGEKVVEQIGVPPRSTAVTRRVFASDGSLMYDTTWRSYYVGEPTVVRLGTKPRPKPEEPKAKGDAKAKPGATDGVTPLAEQETASTTTATPRP
jgi:vancomycin resistance protein YoaR